MTFYEKITLEKTEAAARITDYRLFVEDAHAKFIVPDCSEELFKEISDANHRVKMNLIDGVLEIRRPVNAENGNFSKLPLEIVFTRKD